MAKRTAQNAARQPAQVRGGASSVVAALANLPADDLAHLCRYAAMLGPSATVADVLADLAAKCLPCPGRLPTVAR